MDWRNYLAYRWHATGAIALLIIAAWYALSFRPRQLTLETTQQRQTALKAELAELEQSIEEEQQGLRETPPLPKRFTPTRARALPPSERLQHFLGIIAKEANRYDLRYFKMTPKGSKRHSDYVELPFSISVTGTYAALARYLYELEYSLNFVIRDPTFSRAPGEGGVRAEFELSALLLRADAGADTPPEPAPEDPGEPTTIELARNPFARPPARLATGPDGRRYFLNVLPGFQLGGWMQVQGEPVAIINHEPYREGDTIDGKKVVSITERGVELRDEVRSYFLETEQVTYPRPATDQEAASP